VSAESFVVCYGIRRELDASLADDIHLLEERHHPWFLDARQYKLKFWWGATTTKDKFFVLIGMPLYTFGWEGKHDARLTDTEAVALTSDTKQRIAAAGFTDEPAWHFQFVPDF
jgi:hypothetical protein